MPKRRADVPGMMVGALVLVFCASLFPQSGHAARQGPGGLLPGRTRLPLPLPAGMTDEGAAALIEPTSTHRKQADFVDGDDVGIKSHWALLVAGSAGWWNYRHQADVAHAYQVLRAGGFLKEHIIVMMYDDIADNDENPRKGHIFNRPGGPDVYDGLKHAIDYRGSEVTAENFLAVLAGDAKAVREVGTGRVIGAGKDDRLFLFYSDHGAAGVLGMPTGNFLYAKDLIETIESRHSQGGYREMVVYIEACESGSMFEGLLREDLSVYVTTASNAVESSWGTYCPGMDPSPEPEFSTCLGDLYSVAWLENSEINDLTAETLLSQYDQVLERTSNNFTFEMGSHVMQYGALAIDREKAGDYMGMKHTGAAPAPSTAPSVARALMASRSQTQRMEVPQATAAEAARAAAAASAAAKAAAAALQLAAVFGQHRTVKQRDADLVHLQHKARHAKDKGMQMKAQTTLDEAMQRRKSVDAAVREAASNLLLSLATSDLLATNLDWHPLMQQHSAASTAPLLLKGVAGWLTMASKPLIELLVTDPMGRPAKGVPLVDNWQCLKDMVAVWTDKCGRMDDYSMHHTRFFANLCNAGIGGEGLRGALSSAPSCSGSEDAAAAGLEAQAAAYRAKKRAAAAAAAA